MLQLAIDHPNPVHSLRLAGIDARLCWAGDDDHTSLVLVEPDRANLIRLERYLASNPRLTVLPRA